MLIDEARRVAGEWVRQFASERADFRGAYFSGSTVGRAAGDVLPAASDVDVVVVLAGAAPMKPGKFVFEGVLLEVTYLAAVELADAERVAGSYHLAPSFVRDTVISDPTGRLGELHRWVARTFAEPAWVERRCEDAIARIERGLASIDADAPWHDQVTAWMFPTGVMTHVVLVAARENPTVRLRYLAARGMLERCGMMHLYPRLLGLLGCAGVTRERVQRHLDALASVFDVAASVARTGFFFSSDITAAARPIAIEGSQGLIDAGDHREAVFWIVATHARCQKVLAADASAGVKRAWEPGFRAVVAELLGVEVSGDLIERASAARGFLPELREAARAIIRGGQA